MVTEILENQQRLTWQKSCMLCAADLGIDNVRLSLEQYWQHNLVSSWLNSHKLKENIKLWKSNFSNFKNYTSGKMTSKKCGNKTELNIYRPIISRIMLSIYRAWSGLNPETEKTGWKKFTDERHLAPEPRLETQMNNYINSKLDQEI